jgi:hypothetical protein
MGPLEENILMNGIDRAAHLGFGLRTLAEEELDRVKGGRKTATAPGVTATAFDNLVTDAVVTTDELPTLHDMK